MMLRTQGKMRNKLVVALVAVLLNAIEAKIYPDGACPLFTLLPFTSMYVHSSAEK